VGEQILDSILKVEKQLKKTFITNPSSSEADTLCYIFYNYININQRRHKDLKKYGKIAN
jgi:hypothetical protein